MHSIFNLKKIADHFTEDNRKETTHPSKRWARSRKFGEEFNMKLQAQIVTPACASGVAGW